MRLSLSAALLLLAGGIVWAFTPAARRPLVRSSPRGSVQTSSPLKAAIDKPGMMMWSQSIAEAKQRLTEIESAVQKTRECLQYLEEVAQVFMDYVIEKDTSLTEKATAAKGYLANIHTAASSTEQYLEYLKSVRQHLSTMESFTPQQQDAEEKARSILEGLDETAKVAMEYLFYLERVASAVQQYLANPTSPFPPELANLVGGLFPSFPRPPSVPTSPSVPVAANTPVAGIGTNYLDALSSSSAPPARVGGGGSGSYLDNISSGASSRVGGGMTSYLDFVNGASLPSFGSGVDASTFASPAPPAPVPAPRATMPIGKPPQETATPQMSSSVSTGSYLDTISSGGSRVDGSGTDIQENLIKQASVNDITPSLQMETPKLTQEALTSEVPSGMISLEEAQTHIDAAVQEALAKWKAHTIKELEEKHAAALEAIQQEAEKQLMERGEQWNKGHEEELRQVKKEMETRLEQQRLEAEQDKREAEAKWMEMAEQERTEFTQKVFELVNKAEEEVREQERLSKEMRAEQAAKIERLETELKERQGILEGEKASLIEAMKENKVLAVLMNTLGTSVVTLEADKKLAQKSFEESIQLLREETESKLDLTRKQLTEASTNKMEELLSKITELEANSTKLQRKHEESLKAISEAHKIELKKQQDEFKDSIEKERRAASSMQSVALAEKEELVARVETLESSLSKEREANEEGRKVHAEQIEMLGKEKGDLEKEFLELRDTLEAERMEWKTSIEPKQEELLANLETLETSLSNEREAHAEQIEMVQKEKEDLEKEILELIDTFEAERKEWEISLESRQQEMQSNYEKKVQEMEDRLEKHFKKEKSEIMVIQRNATAKEKVLSERLLSLEAQAQRDKEEYAKRLQQLSDQHSTKIDEILAQLDLVEADHKLNIEAEQESIRQKEAIIVTLRAQLAEAATNTTTLEAERQQDLARVEAVRAEAENARNASKSLQKSLDQLRDDHKKELEKERRLREESIQQVKKEMIAAAEKHNRKIEAEQESIKQKEAIIISLQTQLAEAAANASALEAERKQDLARVEAARAEAENAREASKPLQMSLNQLRNDHKKELEEERRLREEVIQQLKQEMISAAEKHDRKIEAEQESIRQKEAIIATLRAQLAVATANATTLEAERQQDLARVEAARAEAENARNASKPLEISLNQLRDDHKKELEEERRLREEAIQQVKKEMITSVDEQVRKANEQYEKLKDEYYMTMKKVKKIQRELDSRRRELDSSKQEHAAREMELKAELAQLKTALATGEADSAKKMNAYMLEIEAMRTAQKKLQEKLEAAMSESKSTRDRLALVAAEKARLLKDNGEMKSICGELMSIVKREESLN